MKIDKSLLAGSTTMVVLSLLSEGEKYGYQMIRELAQRSDNTFQMKEGTLYPILHGLERDGCVEVLERVADGRTRRYYRLTRKGRGLLEDKVKEWKLFTGTVNDLVTGCCPELA